MPPGTITSLAIQANDPQRVNVFVDGEFAIGISIYVMQDEHLHKGQVLSQADWDRLEQSERASRAWNAALRLLEARPRSEHELRDRLRRKEFAAHEIDTAINRLRELELLDDAQFAKLWINNRQQVSPRGSQALRQELRAKGVARDVADAALSEQIDADSEHAACEAVARGAVHKYANAPDFATFQRKFGGFLLRRGFRYDSVKPIVAALWQEQHADES
jgi:regulatory protein